ncbi:MAG: hypothetical protein ACOCRO_04315 [Halanaerobiales bacterium]
MKKSIFLCLLLVMVLALGSISFAATDTATQTVSLHVDEMALLEIEGPSSISLAVTAPNNNIGRAPNGQNSFHSSIGSMYLHYTSTVGMESSRSISVERGISDAIPAGTKLELGIKEMPTVFGNIGSKTTMYANLNNSGSQDIITGIGSCYTGDGSTDGPLFNYRFKVEDVSELVANDSSSITVTFTLTDN